MAMVTAVAVPVILVASAPAAVAAPIAGGDITTVCAGTTNTTTHTFTLTANCGDVTSALTVPATITTVNGNGFTISATNPPAPATTYTGAVLANAGPGQTMNIENLTVTGPAAGFAFPLPNTCPTSGPPVGGFPGLFGIFFNNASGSTNNVTVLNIFETNTAPGSPACIAGHAIRADASTPQTVTITNTKASNYQRGGLFASGTVTMNVTSSTIGPGSAVPFSIAQNAVQWANVSTISSPAVGATGSITNSTIVGTSFVSTHPVDPTTAASTAVLIFGSNNVTVDHNTITGSADIGISVDGASTGAVISFNAINRPTPPTPDSFGLGVSVGEGSAARLICNTFSGWKTNIDPTTLTQEPCPPPTTTTTTTTVAPTTTAPTTAPPTTVPSVAPTGELPPTGSDSRAPLYVGAVLIGLGTLVVTVTTRRRVRRS
jgi:hypothetical protein